MTRLERQCSGTMTVEQMIAELPRVCDVGCKTNSSGHKEYWIGYKLHVDVADGQIPISCVLTSASLHDSQAAIPLAELTARRVTRLYDLMDRGYESGLIRQHSQQRISRRTGCNYSLPFSRTDNHQRRSADDKYAGA